MKRVNFLKNAMFGATAIVFSLFVLTNCDQRRDGTRSGDDAHTTTANIESERQQLASEFQREINQLNRMITDYETRMEDERLAKDSKDNYRSMVSDLKSAKNDLDSELNKIQNANANNWHERRAEARQKLAEVNAEIEQITAARGVDTDDNQNTRPGGNRGTNQTF